MSEATIRRARPDDVVALGRLSDRVFRTQHTPGTSMPVEFPELFSESNATHLYLAEVGNEPVSLVGMLSKTVYVHGVPISTVSMGSVCTLPEYRGQGYAPALVSQSIDDFAPTTSLLLVSGGLPMYRRAGCVDFGDWWRASYAPQTSQGKTGADLELGQGMPPDASALLALYNAEPLRYHRTPADFERLLGSTRAPEFRANPVATAVFTASCAGRVVAYVVAQRRNADSAALMEWAGARTAIPWLARAVQAHYQVQSVRWFVAPTDVTMLEIARVEGITLEHESNEGTLRVLNAPRLMAEYGPLLLHRYGASLNCVETEPGTWVVHWNPVPGHVTPPSEGLRLSSVAELSTWLFGEGGLKLPFPRTDDLNYV